jgi:hypothetical protein
MLQRRHTSTTSASKSAHQPIKTFADYLFNTMKEILNYGDESPHIELGRWNLDEDHKNRVIKKIDLANSDNSYTK